MSTTLNQITRLNVQIKEYEDELVKADEKKTKLNEELEETKQELEEAKADYKTQKELIDSRMIVLYETSKTTYLDMLIGSKSLSDFLSKYYILEQMAEYDNTLLSSLDTYKIVVETKTASVEKKKKEADNAHETLEAKKGAMEVLIRDKNNLVQNLTKEEIELNEQLEQFEKDKKDIEQKLIELSKQNAIKYSITPSKSGYISPLLGKTKANITTTYYGYSGHTGVDYAIPLRNRSFKCKKRNCSNIYCT